MRLYAYATRYEIHDYELGDIPKLERDMSVYDKNNFLPGTFHYDPKYRYDEESQILYVPRGYNLQKIEGHVGKSVVYKNNYNPASKVSFSMSKPPWSDTQKESVRFLTAMDEYNKMARESQQVLALPTGAGKTYCAIAASSILEMKTIVVVGTDDLRRQWYREILDSTNLSPSAVYMISGVKSIHRLYKMASRKLAGHAFYITTHSSLRPYMDPDSEIKLNDIFIKLGIGIKIVDEAHLQYENTFSIDYSVNVKKNFYLTATFEQSDSKTNAVFQKAFYDVYKLQISPNSRKHVVWIRAHYSSHANAIERKSIIGSRGTNKFKYIEYEMSKPHLTQVFKAILTLLIDRMRVEGKILVVSPKKESCDYFKDVLAELYPKYKACVHYTGNKVDTFEPYGVIFATYSMLGTGNDISGLRVIINLEPIGSKRNTVQLVGRLREYAEDKDTYFIEPVDMSLSNIVYMAGKREDALKNIVKDIKDVELGGG